MSHLSGALMEAYTERCSDKLTGNTKQQREKENILGGIRGNDKKTGSGADHILWPGTGGM